MPKDETRAALIEAGKRMIFETGFNHTGIQAVLSEAKVPKGSFYYYFASKENFGLAVVEDFLTNHYAVRNQFFLDTSLSPLTRLRRYFEFYANRFEQRNFQGGCLLGNLGQELADQNETFRSRVQEAFESWRAAAAACLREAKAAGEIADHWDEAQLADFCLSGWQGAILRMKVSKDRAPIDTYIATVFDSLLKV